MSITEKIRELEGAEMETEERKKCTRCGVNHLLSFYRIKRKYETFRHTRVPKIYYSDICKKCEIEERITKKIDDPFTPKAKKTIYEHARKRNMSSKEFLANYDLSVKYIANLFEDAWLLHELGRGCHSCEKPFDNDLRKFHLDVIDRKRDPTRSNLRVICEHCNLGKGSKPPAIWDSEMAGHRLGEEAIKKGVQIDLLERKSKTTHMNTQLALL